MKVNNKIEINITYFILSLAIFLLNFNLFSPISIIFGSLLTFLLIKLIEKTKILNFKISKFILSLISFVLLIIYLNKLTYYISSNILRNYSTIIISLTLLISAFLLVKKGYHTIIKVILLSTYFILLIFILGIILSSFYLDINNFNLNIFNSNNLIKESLIYTSLMTYIYLILTLPTSSKIKSKELIISNLVNLLLYFFINLVLSKTLVNIYEYPYLEIFKKINLLNFIERIEILFSFNYLFCFYYLFLIMYYQVYNIISFKKKKTVNKSFLFLTILIFIISILIF